MENLRKKRNSRPNLVIIGSMLVFAWSYGVYAFEERAPSAESEIQSCEDQGRRHELLPQGIQPGCYAIFSEHAEPKAIHESPDGTFKAVGYRNIVFLKKNEKIAKLAGSQTKLNAIKALRVDWKNGELWVLESRPLSALVFRTSFDGNIAPIRSLPLKDLEGISGLAVNSTTQEVYFSGAETASIYVFSRLADTDGRKPVNAVTPLRKISGAQTQLQAPQDVAVDEKLGELYVLEAAANQVLVFSVDASGDVAPLRTIRGPLTGISDPKAIEFLTAQGAIQIRNGDGSIVYFGRQDHGDVSPRSFDSLKPAKRF